MSDNATENTKLPAVDVLATPATSSIQRFLFPPHHRSASSSHTHHKTYPWYLVLWLTGVDYFSTLGYQPGIAFLAAGALSPIATAILLFVTLFAALPTYLQVSKHSYAGQGSISMLEHLIKGWWGKVFVLVLIGFAVTDFIITMTLSAADATAHAIENPLFNHWLHGHMIGITFGLLILLAVVFMFGFTEAIGLAVFVAVPYMLLNAVVIGYGFQALIAHPSAWGNWQQALAIRGDWTAIALASLLVFPKLALGLSGFETGTAVMPLIHGEKDQDGRPVQRIRNTGRLLTTAAVLMSVMLITSSFITTLLIPAVEFQTGGKANGRALAYLAHSLVGPAFGTLYDVFTIAILWFAGASAMAGLLSIIPRYLPRFGMSPQWLIYQRPLILVLLFIDLIVTWVFQANVDKQAGAYATGVLVLMLSAAIAVALSFGAQDEDKPGKPIKAFYFWLVAGVFAFTLVDNVWERPDGVIIASIFILVVLVLGFYSRWQRATEMRVEALRFADEESALLWEEIRGQKLSLLPIQHFDEFGLKLKTEEVKRYFRVKGVLALMHIKLMENRSEFFAPLELTIRYIPDTNQYLIVAENAVSIANAIAYLTNEIQPLSIILFLTGKNRIKQIWRFLLFGEGEIGMLVYQILVEHWEKATIPGGAKPQIFIMNDGN